MEVKRKLAILADAAKYDASCASSGSRRKGRKDGLGNTRNMGICHSYTPDGRCVSLLKILLTNYCIYRTTLPTHPAQCLVLQDEGEAPLPVLTCGSIDLLNFPPGCRDRVAASLAQGVGHLHGRAP